MAGRSKMTKAQLLKELAQQDKTIANEQGAKAKAVELAEKAVAETGKAKDELKKVKAQAKADSEAEYERGFGDASKKAEANIKKVELAVKKAELAKVESKPEASQVFKALKIKSDKSAKRVAALEEELVKARDELSEQTKRADEAIRGKVNAQGELRKAERSNETIVGENARLRKALKKDKRNRFGAGLFLVLGGMVAGFLLKGLI